MMVCRDCVVILLVTVTGISGVSQYSTAPSTNSVVAASMTGHPVTAAQQVAANPAGGGNHKY